MLNNGNLSLINLTSALDKILTTYKLKAELISNIYIYIYIYTHIYYTIVIYLSIWSYIIALYLTVLFPSRNRHLKTENTYISST